MYLPGPASFSGTRQIRSNAATPTPIFAAMEIDISNKYNKYSESIRAIDKP